MFPVLADREPPGQVSLAPRCGELGRCGFPSESLGTATDGSRPDIKGQCLPGAAHVADIRLCRQAGLEPRCPCLQRSVPDGGADRGSR